MVSQGNLLRKPSTAKVSNFSRRFPKTMNREWTIISYNMQSNAVKFDNFWQLRPSSSNSFSGETFATRQAFESNLRINWRCKVLFKGAILHMSGCQNVGSSKQSYCGNSTGTGFTIFTCSYIFLTYLQFTKIQKKSGLRDRCTSRGNFANFGTDWMPVAWLAGLYGIGFLVFFSCSMFASGVYLHICCQRTPRSNLCY